MVRPVSYTHLDVYKRQGLRWGELNPDETIPTFIAELEASGINTIIEECQTQLDAYLASK